MKDFGITLLIIAGILAIVGIVLLLGAKTSWFGHLGHLPGDIHFEGKRGSFHFPIVTCIIASIVLTVLVNIVLRLFNGSMK